MVIEWKDWPHVLRMQQFSADTLEAIIDHALKFEEALIADRKWPRVSEEKRRGADGAEHQRRIRTLFYQPSTRTETTFIDAIEGLGGSVHAVKDPQAFSGAQKGESFSLATMAYTTAGNLGYLRGCDGIIVRHQDDGAAQRAVDTIETALRNSSTAVRPLFVINAGDGKKGQHPTQALVDLATIAKQRQGQRGHFLDDLSVLFPGDVARSRVINSLLYAFGRFDDRAKVRTIFCCPEGLGPHQEMLMYLARHKVDFDFVTPREYPDAIERADLHYLTRLQREYDKDQDMDIPPFNREDYVFRKEYMKLLKEGAFVMHPLPINEDPDDPPPEIDQELIPLAIAGHPQLVFGQQSLRGLPTRAALLDLIYAGLDSCISGPSVAA